MNQSHKLGLLLVTLSAITFSTAGLFVKGLAAGPYAILFWRSIGVILAVAAYSYAHGQLTHELRRFGPSALAASVVGALGSLAFVPAFKLTSIANVSIVYAAAPFFSAIIAYAWMRERPARAVLWGSGFVLIGVAIIVSGSSGTSSLEGDLLALLMTFAMALMICIYRRYPHTPSHGPAIAMALLVLPAGLVFDRPFDLSSTEILLCLLFGAIFAVASVSLAEGARRLPAAQTSLLSALEMPFAPLWAAIFLAELPTTNTWIGGALIATAIFISSINQKQPIGESLANNP